MEDLEKLLIKYRSYRLEETIDYEKFNLYGITLHSTSIEGASLTLIDTQLLIEEGLTPKGKPLTHSLMVKDHFKALLWVLDLARQNLKIEVNNNQNINAHIMHNTGGIYETALGKVDASKGEFRKMNNFVGNRYFMNFDKVPKAVGKLVEGINHSFSTTLTNKESLELSWKAHFDLVSIHPFVDGNGRTARLLENFLQHKMKLPLGRVFKEDKAAYYQALEETREIASLNPFISFMTNQYCKHLLNEISKFEDMKNGGNEGKGYSFVF